MFTVARTLVQNKVVVLAILIGCYFAFAGNKEAPKPKNAWDTVAAAPATAKEATWTEKGLKLANQAAKAAGVEEYMPQALQEQAISGLNKSEEALTKVNNGIQ